MLWSAAGLWLPLICALTSAALLGAAVLCQLKKGSLLSPVFEHLHEWDFKLTAQKRQWCLLLSEWHAGRVHWENERAPWRICRLHSSPSQLHPRRSTPRLGSVSIYSLWRMKCILPDLLLLMQLGKHQPQWAQNEHLSRWNTVHYNQHTRGNG